MSRLTRKVEYEGETLYGSPIGTKCDDFDQLQNIYNKLGKLEDLEDELGCPLDVVFKAIKNGIDGYLELILEYDEKDGWYFNAIWKYNDFGDYGNILYLKDYKKTWWLKEDLSE